ncbi:MAG: hypothetical protein WKF76_02505 [Nocardioidaceae bacterium]
MERGVGVRHRRGGGRQLEVHHEQVRHELRGARHQRAARVDHE